MNKNVTIRFLIGLLVIFGLMSLAATTASASSGDTLYVQKQGVNLYQAPGAGAPVIMALGRGRKLKETRRQARWIRVYVYGEIGKSGWIASSAVGPNDPDAPPEPENKPQPVKAKPKPATVPPFVLSVEGSAGRFRANCVTVGRSGRKTRHEFAESSPDVRIRIDAEAVSCGVRNTGIAGRLTARLDRGDRLVARHSATGSFSSVHVRSRGPWGKARSMTCNRVAKTLENKPGWRRACIQRSRPYIY
jgi:hypothetical protein